MTLSGMFDQDALGRSLSAFARRPAMPDGNPGLAALMHSLREQRLDQLPLPGMGHTLLRWQVLAQVAACDLALAKIYEGHTDALAILAECRTAHLAAGDLWAVWAAEPPGARVRIVRRDADQVYLMGRKSWCSGALEVNRAVISVWDEQDRAQLVAIEVGGPCQQISTQNWQAVGMAQTQSADIEFEECPAVIVGEPGEYVQRPGFWHGAGGIAACWYGAATGLAEHLHRHAHRLHIERRADPHALSHLGAVDAALGSAAALLRESAREIDQRPFADVSRAARRLRAHVEQAAGEVISHVGRALGATPFCREAHFARLSADLPVFMRQSHAERDLAQLGLQVAHEVSTGWKL